MDGKGEQACTAWLRPQLHDRCRACGHYRRRGNASAHLGPGGRNQNHDRSDGESARREAARRRYRRWKPVRCLPLLDKAITRHIPAGERYQRADGMFPCPGFAYDAERDIYLCQDRRGRQRRCARSCALSKGHPLNLNSRGMSARKWRCASRTSRSTIASSACVLGVSPAPATSSTLRPSGKISRHSQATSGCCRRTSKLLRVPHKRGPQNHPNCLKGS